MMKIAALYDHKSTRIWGARLTSGRWVVAKFDNNELVASGITESLDIPNCGNLEDYRGRTLAAVIQHGEKCIRLRAEYEKTVLKTRDIIKARGSEIFSKIATDSPPEWSIAYLRKLTWEDAFRQACDELGHPHNKWG